MPVRKVPPKIVARLSKVVAWAEKRGYDVPTYLSRMKNADRRVNWPEVQQMARKDQERFTLGQRAYLWRTRAELPGYRVRQPNVLRNLPRKNGLELIIKVVHGAGPKRPEIKADAFEIIKKVKEVVREYAANSDGSVRLLAPYAYPLGKNLILMAKTHAPTVEEVITGRLTPEGKELIKRMAKRHAEKLIKEDPRVLTQFGSLLGSQATENAIAAVTRYIRTHADPICHSTGLDYGDILVLDNKKSLTFMAMPETIIKEAPFSELFM